ncbi:hypothetical protein OAJ14_03435 [Polaribacter sp.]|nr:hypothetical protein [Polaribacter sp.]
METNKLTAYENRKVNPTTIWMLFLFFGWSYGSLNKVGLQILFYLTLGGLGIWFLIRFFTLSDAIKTFNRNIAIEVGLNNKEMALLKIL